MRAHGVTAGNSVKRHLPHPQELPIRCPPSTYTCLLGKEWTHQEQGEDGVGPPQLSGAHLWPATLKLPRRDPVDLSTSICAAAVCVAIPCSASTCTAPSPQASELSVCPPSQGHVASPVSSLSPAGCWGCSKGSPLPYHQAGRVWGKVERNSFMFVFRFL